jgi:hypothetical protein
MTGKITITLKLLETVSQIEKKIIKSIAKQMDKSIRLAIPAAISDLKAFIYETVGKSSEVQSLLGGDLRGNLGLTEAKAQEAVEDISSMISQAIAVEYKAVKQRGSGFTGKLTIKIQPSHFQNILGITGSVTSYYSIKYGTLVELDWLDWLLMRGDDIIVSNFQFEPKSAGRSGMGVMKIGGSWRVPPEFSGTKDDNFVTRCITTPDAKKEISKILEKNISAKVKL